MCSVNLKCTRFFEKQPLLPLTIETMKYYSLNQSRKIIWRKSHRRKFSLFSMHILDAEFVHLKRDITITLLSWSNFLLFSVKRK